MQATLRAAVVEDDEDEFLRLADLLRAEPFYQVNADWLKEPARAVQAILEGDYQIIFLDYKMGLISGLAIARDLRAMDCDLPIVMVTGAGNPAIERAAIHAEVDYFLTKDQLNEALLSTTLHFSINGRLMRSGVRGIHHTLTGLPRRRLFQEMLEAAVRVAGSLQTLELGCLEVALTPTDSQRDVSSYEEQHAWREFILRLYAAVPESALLGHLGPRAVGCLIGGEDTSRETLRREVEKTAGASLHAAGVQWNVRYRVEWRAHEAGWSGMEWVSQCGISQHAPAWRPPHHSLRPAPKPAAELRHYGRHALMVEDNRVNQMLAQKILESLGVTCDLAANGEEAIRRVASEYYDVIFMDIEMPVMDGFEAASRLREQRLSVTPIIALTGREDDDIRAKCRKVHMNGHLLKPLKKPALTRVLDRIFDL